MKVNSIIAAKKGKVCTRGQTALFILASGWVIRSMAMGFTAMLMGGAITVSTGRMICMGTASGSTLMGYVTMASSLQIRSKATEYTTG